MTVLLSFEEKTDDPSRVGIIGTPSLQADADTKINYIWLISIVKNQSWFSYVGKIPGDPGFNFLPTILYFADISDNRRKSVSETPCLCVIGGLEPSNLED